MGAGLFHGWVVAVKRRGRRYFGVFPDRKYGGRHGALKRALEWRDELEAKLPPPVKLWRRCSARSRTGIVGVVLLRKRIRGRLFRQYWAHWRERGRQVGRAFSVNKYGEAGARARAAALRREAVARILTERREELLAETLRERATLRR